jgi:hypothetical protein
MPNCVSFFYVRLEETRSLQINKGTQGEEMLACIFYAAARIKISEDRLRRKTHDLRIRVAKFMDVGGEIF